VAVIGNAASALQFIPRIAAAGGAAARLPAQRQLCHPRRDRAYSAREKALFRRLPIVQKLLRLLVYLRGEWVFYPVLRSRSRLLRRLWENWCEDFATRRFPTPACARSSPRTIALAASAS
jgi:cation diffusion facilitator CzcD-associated flavoprotein CzcO